MGKTSNTAKQIWNAEHYTQIKVSVKPETAAAFRSACQVAGVSMASAISTFMMDYPTIPPKKGSLSVLTTTRRDRRNALNMLLGFLNQIRDAEELYRDRIPENLAGSSAYDAADETVSLLSDAIDLLESAYQ